MDFFKIEIPFLTLKGLKIPFCWCKNVFSPQNSFPFGWLAITRRYSHWKWIFVIFRPTTVLHPSGHKSWNTVLDPSRHKNFKIFKISQISAFGQYIYILGPETSSLAAMTIWSSKNLILVTYVWAFHIRKVRYQPAEKQYLNHQMKNSA